MHHFNSIKHHSFVYTEIRIKQFKQFNLVCHLFGYSLNIKQFYLTHIRCYHFGSEWTCEQWNWRDNLHSLKLRNLSFIIWWLSHPGHLFGVSYTTTFIQLVNSTPPVDLTGTYVSNILGTLGSVNNLCARLNKSLKI